MTFSEWFVICPKVGTFCEWWTNLRKKLDVQFMSTSAFSLRRASSDNFAFSEFSSALRRLVTMVRGIGDPLIAVFTRCYLVRIATSVENVDKQLLKENFSDFLKSYGQVRLNSVHGILLKSQSANCIRSHRVCRLNCWQFWYLTQTKGNSVFVDT